MVKLRLKPTGTKHHRTYRVVVAECAKSRDGRVIEILGAYSAGKNGRQSLDKDRALFWLLQGAVPTEQVSRILSSQGVLEDLFKVRPGARNKFKYLLRARNFGRTSPESKGEGDPGRFILQRNRDHDGRLVESGRTPMPSELAVVVQSAGQALIETPKIVKPSSCLVKGVSMDGITKRRLTTGAVEIVIEKSKVVTERVVKRISNFTISVSVPGYERDDEPNNQPESNKIITQWVPISGSGTTQSDEMPGVIYLAIQEPISGALLELREITLEPRG
jgi:small subunit ribosomal protein S16